MTVINGVEIYRELMPTTPEHVIEWLDRRDQLWIITDDNGAERTYIDNDVPRPAEITIPIVDNTQGFALFTEDGQYVSSYRSLDRAISAQGRVKLVVQAEVEGVEPDPEADEPRPETDL